MISGILASLLLTAAATGSKCETDLDRLLDSLTAAAGQELAFVESRQSELLTEPQVVTGTLIREDDGRLIRRVSQPTSETQILTDRYVEVRRADGYRSRFSLSRAPELATLRNALDSLLSGQPQDLRAHFDLQLDRLPEDAHWRLALTPLETALAESVDKLVLNGVDDRIESFELHLVNGEVIRTEIQPAP